MKQPSIKDFTKQIILMAVILFVLSPLFRSDMSLQYNLSYSIVGGVVLGGLLYFFDLWRANRNRPR